MNTLRLALIDAVSAHLPTVDPQFAAALKDLRACIEDLSIAATKPIHLFFGPPTFKVQIDVSSGGQGSSSLGWVALSDTGYPITWSLDSVEWPGQATTVTLASLSELNAFIDQLASSSESPLVQALAGLSHRPLTELRDRATNLLGRGELLAGLRLLIRFLDRDPTQRYPNVPYRVRRIYTLTMFVRDYARKTSTADLRAALVASCDESSVIDFEAWTEAVAAKQQADAKIASFSQ